MQETRTRLTNKPAWVDLASADPAASRDFYGKLFGWNIEVSADPQYGGYATAKVGDKSVAGIGPKMMAEAPTAWSLYIGTDNADAVAAKVAQAGGTVIVPPMAVGDQGRMAVFQDPAGAYISAWQEGAMGSFLTNAPGAFDWGELNARGAAQVIPFYERVFGWTHESRPMGEGMPDYTLFKLADERVAGATEMNPMAPPEMPSYWLVYFKVNDVDAAFAQAIAIGARELVAPLSAIGQRFAILMDPQGAVFGLSAPAAG